MRVGTRESQLARLQTDIVIAALSGKFPELKFEVVPITTGGDKVLDRPIAELGGRGVFVKELEEALYADRVDFVVHSLKDLPTELPKDLVLACVLDREDPRDVLVSNNELTISQLPAGTRVATSSRRRTAQIKSMRSDLNFCDIRGNIPTRLRKHSEGQCDAMVLAAAGLLRLGMASKISEYLDISVSTPAVGQGALAVECRESDTAILQMLKDIENKSVRAEITAERAFLDLLGGGCSVPVGAIGETLKDGRLKLTGCVAALDGSEVIRLSLESSQDKAYELGNQLAERVQEMGADRILRELKQSAPSAISPP
ncbi:MAG TPA: hydroxymethylbilane synthase [Drouetiella sp.]